MTETQEMAYCECIAKIAMLEYRMRLHPESARRLADTAIAATIASEAYTDYARMLTLMAIAQTAALVLGGANAAMTQAAETEEKDIDEDTEGSEHGCIRRADRGMCDCDACGTVS